MDNVGDIYELSPMQQGMLFHTLYDSKSDVYFDQLRCVLRGDLNVSAFKRAWQYVVERHPVLRTAFYWEDLEKPLQVVYRQVDLPWVEQDWRGLTPAMQHERLAAFLPVDREQGFALDQAPLMRCALLQVEEYAYHFVWSYHHLLMDGWSLPIVLQEVFLAYTAFDQGQRISLDTPRPYRDYILWLQEQNLSQAEAFWRLMLQGFTAPTPLVTARTVDGLPPQQERYAEQRLQLSAATTTALQSLARQHHLTLNTLVQGAWALLLSRYSGEEDVVFGVTVSGRPTTLAGAASMVGLFINTLPARVHVSGQIPLLPWLQQLQAQQVEREQYVYSPLVEIQGWSDVPRRLSLFESLLVFENYPVGTALQERNGSLEIEDVDVFERVHYPLTVTVTPGPALLLRMSYESRYFDTGMMPRMAGHLQTLIEEMVAQPQQRLAAFSLLTAAERQQMLVAWNDTQNVAPQAQSIQQLFEAQVARTPEAVAVVYAETQVTYEGLNRRANQLAHYLRALGVGSEVLVGLCVERSVEMVIGLLGILKAGGAYVPLDPTYPTERLTFMLADAQVRVLLTQASLADALPTSGVQRLCLDTDWAAIVSHPVTNPRCEVTPAHTAYVIYTSGSTGQPKGVQIPQEAVVNFLQAMRQQPGMSANDTLLAVTTISFDIAALELYLPLVVGGRVVVAPRTVTADGVQLDELLHTSGVTVMQATPTTWRLLLAAGRTAGPHVRLLSGGEALPGMLARELLSKGGGLWNLYGPTETTIWSAVIDVGKLGQEVEPSDLPVSIGRPIANTVFYLLDSHLQPVPIGVDGELYIGGVGLARGYLNRPALSAEKFIPALFSHEPGARLYRTGDRMRYLADGRLAFLGRLDDQVKLRGLRIELREIETVLGHHPAVSAAAVVAQDERNGEKRLVAYVMPKAEHSVSAQDLRDFVQAKLPVYMVPTVFMALEKLPLTPNGKVDRRALPAPDTGQERVNTDFVAPRTPTEDVLAGLWADVLGLEQVGVSDNFFELGGHSLLATQLVSRVRTTFAMEVPVRCVFDMPTVAGLSAHIDTAYRAEAEPLAPPLVPGAHTGTLSMSFAQQRLWFLDQLEGASATYNIPLAVRLRGPLNVAILVASLTEVVRRHEALRTTFPTVQGFPVQDITPPQPVALPIVDVEALSAKAQAMEVQRLAQAEARQPFDLAQGPLLRSTLIRADETEHVLLVTMHHIVSDGWSMGILVHEVAALYAAGCRSEPSPLPPLPIQYADFARWQRTWLQGEVLETQLAYWHAHLEGAPEVLVLPTDRPRPPVQSFRGGTVPMRLNGELTQQLRVLSRQAGATLFMTLLGAFATFLSRYSGQEDVVIGTPIANRTRQETEGLIGFFVNTLALRLTLEGNLPFDEMLTQIRRVTLEAYAHQDVPFEKLIEELQLERNLSHTPLFQVAFALQHAPLASLELPELTLAPLALESDTAKFDLTLMLQETAQGLYGMWEYNRDLFKKGTIQRMAKHFETLLAGVVAQPRQCLWALPLLTEREQQQVLVRWNATQTTYPETACIHQLFEAQAARTPEAVAVVWDDQQLTYGALNRRANQLAHHLRALGIGPDVLVGICVERSLDMVVGLLGILKAGGAYVPLDPTYPAERLAFMLEDSQTPVLLTQEPLVEGLPVNTVQVLCLDTGWEAIAQAREDNPVSTVTAEHLAYVIYTSGSTGIPKGVAIAHQAINRLVCNTNYITLTPTDRVAQASNASFDAATFEIWGALVHGARLVGIATEVNLSPSVLAAHLRAHQITVLFVTTALFNQIARDEPEAFAEVCHLLFGGEAVDPHWVAAVCQQGPPARLLHVYGPTESTTFASWYEVTEVAAGATTLPIGRPIANTQLYVLDRYLYPVPIGVGGDLYIGGAGLGRGYLQRPGLTAAQFIPHPFSQVPGARLYKTGDIARYLPDGAIEFLGRGDEQVKVRGFRIELGEIAAVLSQHPAVREAVVLARHDAPGTTQLVGYVVPQPAHVPTPRDMQRFLQTKLPSYMLPTTFVILEVWPLTPNGKVDRQALPVPAPGQRGVATGFVAPRTPTEEMVAGIWAQVLGLEQVGIEDNFFDVGGHSLLATQVVSRIRAAFAVELLVRCVFEAPTVADLSAHIDTARREPTRSLIPPIVPVTRTGNLPLSFAQQRLWFLDQFEGKSATYNVPLAVRLTGSLHVPALEASLTEIVRRHEALRTTFPAVQGIPVQVIAPHQPAPVPVVDLQTLPAEVQVAEVERLATAEAQGPFDLARDALLRATLVRLGAQEHIFLVTMHHIIADGWSLGVMIHEMASFYAASCRSEPSSFTALPIQYVDFAHWQRDWLQGDELATQLTYWQEQLTGAPAALALPTDYPRPLVQTFHGAIERFQLSAELTQQLVTLSRQAGVTLFMTLLSAFATLLFRYSGQEDIVIGSPIANRNRQEIEGLIGFFVNTLALRLDIAGAPLFSELLARVRQVTLDAYAHQDLPFEKLVGELQPERSLSHTPLFQVVFMLQNAPWEPLELPGLTLISVDIHNDTAKFDLTLSMVETSQGLQGKWEYSSDLFEATTIRRMTEHFETLLVGLVTHPTQRVTTVPMLTAAERYQLLVEWNNTHAAYPQDQCLPQWFEAQVAQTPDAMAVVDDEAQLTYRVLNRRANQLAHSLRARGVGPEVLVGLCVERSLDLVIGLLGILKAGGAYVPLDPTYPTERLASMMADSQVSVLVTQPRLVEALPTERVQHVICLDTSWVAIAQESTANPRTQLLADHPAYVLYTSGSTGQPKGVVIPHHAINNHMRWMQEAVPLTTHDCVVQKTPVSFDASVWEFYAPLLVGAQLVLARPDGHQDSAYLVELMETRQVTILQLVPSLLRLLLEEPRLAACRSLRRVFCGGEALSGDLPTRLRTRLEAVEVYNLYGPTEATIDATCWHWNATSASSWVPIGRPIANTQLYVLDTHLQPVPIGVGGEVYIGGAGIARGYLHRPALTAERFMPHAFSEVPGVRLYKTGDLARYLPDGNLEFLGRLDHQVKLRGFRIELGEIEVVLGQHPAVREAVVLAREDVAGDLQLVAYVVPKPEHEAYPSDLRRFVQAKLPAYMVPVAFVLLEALPLTPNGKIDRRALPTPDATRRGLDVGFVAPRTPTEALLASIWAEVLGLEQVGSEDNFFDLGGHSLLATQLVSRLRTPFAVEIPVRCVFEAPTVAELSVHIDTAQRADQALVAPPIVPVTREEDLPLSFAQQRLWFLDQLEGKSATYNIPVALRLTGLLHVDALAASLTEIVHRHEALRTTFSAVQGVPVQVIGPSQPVPLLVVDIQALSAEMQAAEVRRLATAEAQCPFDLAQGLLLRATLLQLGEDDHVLLVTMHHIVSDGWSMGILVREVAALYTAGCRGELAPIPPLPVQYADFSHWQRAWLQGEVLETQLAYWRAQLTGAPAVLELPTDRPRPPMQTFRGGVVSFGLRAELMQQLKMLSRQTGVTLYMTLLGAFATLLYRYSGQADLVIGSPIANRTRQETEELIGLFVNTLALRLDLTRDPTFHELLVQVRQVTLGSYVHQDLPFEKLVEELQPARNFSHSPLFQVMFILQNAPREALALPGLTLTLLEMDSGTARFDLTLSMEETAQGLYGTWEYNSDLFDAATIRQMTDHFQRLLEAIVAHPQQHVSALPLLSDTERHQLLEAWNATQAMYPHEACLQHFFEVQVEQTPEAVAVVCADQQVTYAALNRRANHLAHRLRALGVGPEVQVGLCVERSVEMMVGLLGILKAGGVYVPLDPAYPSERLAFMLADAQVPVLVTREKLAVGWSEHVATVVYLDAGWVAIGSEGAVNPPISTTPDNPAYAIYTSGSTGQPKGVLGLHRGAVNRLQWMWENWPFEASEMCCQKTSLGFVDSVWEIFGPLLQGIPTVIIPDDVLKDPHQLVHTLASWHVTRLVLVPSLLRVILTTFPDLQSRLPRLRYWITSGEALPVELARHFHQSLPESILFNLYGSSEVSADATWYDTRQAVSLPCVPIGVPIANTQAYILDRQRQLVPVGVLGDLYIGGAGLARGYLNRPTWTAETFIPHPWSEVPGERLYQTGDVARYLPDGTIEFLGRADHQVKLRGFRIELGEIETVLAQHPTVGVTIVVVREDVASDARLVAYIVPQEGQAPTESALRAFLREKLPDYMVPAAFVILETLPLLPNGKIDHRALPAPDASMRVAEERFVPPREPIESHLVQIWEDVLDVHPIGVGSNFFDLGGHSILAVRLMAHICQRFGSNLPIATLFRAPTVEQLARILRQQTDSAVWSPLVPIQPEGSLQPFFCVHPSGGNPLYLHNLARHLGLNQPFYGLQAVGLDGKSEPFTRIEDMAAHYIEVLQTVRPQRSYLLGGHSFGAYVAFEMAQQLQKQGNEVALLAILDMPAPVFGTYPIGLDWDNARWVCAYIEVAIERALGKSLGVSYEAIAHLEPDEQLRYVMERLSRLNLLPPDMGIIQVWGLLRVFKANYQAYYVPQEVYPTRIALFRASEVHSGYVPDEDTPLELTEVLQDPTWGWNRFAVGSVDLHVVPGSHESLTSEPNVRILAERLRVCLEQAQAGEIEK